MEGGGGGIDVLVLDIYEILMVSVPLFLINVIINRSKKVLHIQFCWPISAQSPQYSIFKHMSFIIMKALLFCLSFVLK